MPHKDKEKEQQRQATKYQRIKEKTPFVQKCWALKSKATVFNTPFDLDATYLEALWTGFCAISGMPISLWMANRRDENHAEIDKVFPEFGYTKGNVQWVSRRFNRIKSDGSEEDHKMIIDYLKAQKKEYGNGPNVS